MELWAHELLETARRGVLATISPEGRPHAVPVCFALDEGDIVSPVDEKPKSGRPLARLRNIARNPRVCLLVDRWDENWRALAWVRVDGEASVLPRGAARPAALAALRAKYPQYRAMALEERPLIVIAVERVTVWRAEP